MAPAAVGIRDSYIGGYRCVSRIAVGALGTIWKALDVGGPDKDPVAIKLLRPELSETKRHRLALRNEWRVGSDFSHPSLLHYYEFGEHNRLPYIIMELFLQQNLRSWLQAGRQEEVLGVVDNLVVNTAEGLHHVHERGVLHRDVKPENILLGGDGTVKVIDFSVSVMGMDRWLTLRRRAAGSPSYTAPEQIQNKSLTPAADIYSLGSVLYEVLAARPPFLGKDAPEIFYHHIRTEPTPPSRFNPRLTLALDNLLLSMLAKDPASRPQDIQEFLRHYRQISLFKD